MSKIIYEATKIQESNDPSAGGFLSRFPHERFLILYEEAAVEIFMSQSNRSSPSISFLTDLSIILFELEILQL